MIITRIERDTLNSRNVWEINVVNDNGTYYICKEYIANRTKVIKESIEQVTNEFALKYIGENKNFIVEIYEGDYSEYIGSKLNKFLHEEH